MKLKPITLLLAACVLSAPALYAQDKPKSEPIYGYRMMSDPERNDYRDRMRNARSVEERQAIRDEHRKLMEARAKERGATLPEPRGPRGPGAGGPGYGPAAGKGPGYGPRGEGKGPGYGPGPRGDCPAGQDCPGPGAGKGPGPRQ